MPEWQTLVAIAAVIIAGFSLLARLLDKSLSIREHDEFRSNVKDQFRDWREQFNRDIERVDDRIDKIEQKR